MEARSRYFQRVEEALFSQLLFGLSVYKQLGSSRPRGRLGEGTHFPGRFHGDARARIPAQLAGSGPLSKERCSLGLVTAPGGCDSDIMVWSLSAWPRLSFKTLPARGNLNTDGILVDIKKCYAMEA